MKRMKRWLAPLVMMIQAGCMTTTGRDAPAPVVGEQRTDDVQVTPYRRLSQPMVQEAQPLSDAGTVALLDRSGTDGVQPSAAPGKAARLLMERAEAQRQAGDLTAAAASLERAIRIEPRNARLWNRLAAVRLGQRQYAQAAELAAKSNSLAGSAERALQQDNWLIIAKARRQRGDVEGARHAERQAAALGAG